MKLSPIGYILFVFVSHVHDNAPYTINVQGTIMFNILSSMCL